MTTWTLRRAHSSRNEMLKWMQITRNSMRLRLIIILLFDVETTRSSASWINTTKQRCHSHETRNFMQKRNRNEIWNARWIKSIFFYWRIINRCERMIGFLAGNISYGEQIDRHYIWPLNWLELVLGTTKCLPRPLFRTRTPYVGNTKWYDTEENDDIARKRPSHQVKDK